MLTINCPKCSRSLSFNYASPGDMVMCRDCNIHIQTALDGTSVLANYYIDSSKLPPRLDDRLCANCHVIISGGGVWEGQLRFCGPACWEHYYYPDFCANCIAETTAESPSSNSRFNGIGTDFLGRYGDACPNCFSVIRRRWFLVFLIPTFPLGYYRVKYCTSGNAVTGDRTFKARHMPPERLRESSSRTPA